MLSPLYAAKSGLGTVTEADFVSSITKVKKVPGPKRVHEPPGDEEETDVVLASGVCEVMPIVSVTGPHENVNP